MKITEECIACGTCVDACPVDAIIESGEIYELTGDCSECRTCMDVCQVDAISD